MGLLFKSKKQRKAEEQPHIVAAGSLALYKYVQRIWADMMAKHTGTFSRKTWITSLVLFILFGSGCSIYLIVRAISSEIKTMVPVSQIKKPAHVTETGETDNTSVQETAMEYVRVKQFRLYMDSLARSPSGRIIYDSIIRSRPGLMDSVRFIEIYYKQSKNEVK